MIKEHWPQLRAGLMILACVVISVAAVSSTDEPPNADTAVVDSVGVDTLWVTVEIPNVPTGKYAIAVIQDLNEN
jgi:uncharacterized protein (DUF2141 family)